MRNSWFVSIVMFFCAWIALADCEVATLVSNKHKWLDSALWPVWGNPQEFVGVFCIYTHTQSFCINWLLFITIQLERDPFLQKLNLKNDHMDWKNKPLPTAPPKLYDSILKIEATHGCFLWSFLCDAWTSEHMRSLNFYYSSPLAFL